MILLFQILWDRAPAKPAERKGEPWRGTHGAQVFQSGRLLSAVLCGIAWAVDNAFATSMFAYLTGGIVLVFLAVRKLSGDAYGR
jgi:hypothetical protein